MIRSEFGAQYGRRTLAGCLCSIQKHLVNDMAQPTLCEQCLLEPPVCNLLTVFSVPKFVESDRSYNTLSIPFRRAGGDTMFSVTSSVLISQHFFKVCHELVRWFRYYLVFKRLDSAHHSAH